MLQKEVALRMLANPNSKDYSRMSVMAQTFCNVKYETENAFDNIEQDEALAYYLDSFRD